MSAPESTPTLPHVTSQFYSWLWWHIEAHGGELDLDEPVGAVEVWIDERLAFRVPGEAKVTAVLTGDNPAATLESRAALAGGKVLDEMRIGLRRDSREFLVTLKGATMDLTGVKLPAVLDSAEDEAVYDRMFLYEELCLLVGGLFERYSSLRTSPSWDEREGASLRAWLAGATPSGS